MGDLRKRLHEQIRFIREDMESYKKRLEKNPSIDSKGTVTHREYHDMRFLSIAEFALDADATKFKEALAGAVKLYLTLCHRRKAGEDIERSYITYTNLNVMPEALIAGDAALAVSTAKCIGAHLDYQKKETSELNITMGECYRVFILNDEERISGAISAFQEATGKKENQPYKGYAEAFSALYSQREPQFNKALKEVAQSHERLTKKGGRYSDTPDELLCINGIGLALLAKRRRVSPVAQPPFIPASLLA